MPGDVLRYAPYVNMAPTQDPALRPVGFRPRLPTATTPFQHHPSQQYQQQRHQSPFFHSARFPPPGLPIPPPSARFSDSRPHPPRGGWDYASSAAKPEYPWEYASPVATGYPYFTPPMSNGSMYHPAPMIAPPGLLSQQHQHQHQHPQYAVPHSSMVVPPRLPDRHIIPYAPPPRGFWVDQFASLDVHATEPLPQDWHPFGDEDDNVPTQPVTGGVMAVLDYDLSVMSDFVANVSCNFINVRKPWRALTVFVEKVLNQTRLPSSTVILALTYLSKRLGDVAPVDSTPLIPTGKLHEYLTLSLLLANKFLDDNTFTNSSWSDISGIPRAELNVAEREWLVHLGYSLHVNPLESKGWSTWRKAWETWQFDATGKQSPLLTPVLLSRSNSQRGGDIESPRPFPSSKRLQQSTKWTPQSTSAYLTPPISPTVDTGDEYSSPITPPSKQWLPQPPRNITWRALPNSRNVPLALHPAVPLKFASAYFWDPEKVSGSPWCECVVCTYRTTSLDHIPHATNMAR